MSLKRKANERKNIHRYIHTCIHTNRHEPVTGKLWEKSCLCVCAKGGNGLLENTVKDNYTTLTFCMHSLLAYHNNKTTTTKLRQQTTLQRKKETRKVTTYIRHHHHHVTERNVRCALFAPASRSILTMSMWPFAAATMSGHDRNLSSLLTSALALISTCSVSSCPCCAAKVSGVGQPSNRRLTLFDFVLCFFVFFVFLFLFFREKARKQESKKASKQERKQERHT